MICQWHVKNLLKHHKLWIGDKTWETLLYIWKFRKWSIFRTNLLKIELGFPSPYDMSLWHKIIFTFPGAFSFFTHLKDGVVVTIHSELLECLPTDEEFRLTTIDRITKILCGVVISLSGPIFTLETTLGKPLRKSYAILSFPAKRKQGKLTLRMRSYHKI